MLVLVTCLLPAPTTSQTLSYILTSGRVAISFHSRSEDKLEGLGTQKASNRTTILVRDFSLKLK